MNILIILFMVLLLSLSYVKDHKLSNPSTLFIGLWLCIILLCNFQLFGLFEIESSTYLLVLGGCLFFLIGDFVGMFKFKLTKNKEKNYYRTIIPPFKLIIFIAFIILFINTMDNIRLYLQGASLSEVRYGNYTSNTGSGLGILTTYFAYPVLCAASFILIEKNIKESAALRKFALPFLLVFIIILFNGARLSIIQIIITIISSFILFNRINFNFKSFSKYILLVLFAIGVFYFMTYSRSNNGFLYVLESMYVYVCGSLLMLRYVNMGTYFTPLTYGATSFLGLLRPFYNVLALIGIDIQNYFYDAERYAILLQYTIIPITDHNTTYNYFSTCFSYFLKDYSYTGLIVLSFFYGFICSKCYRKMRRHMDVRTVAIYIWLLCGIYTSMMEFQFSSLTNCMVLFYIYIFTSKKVISSENVT